MSPVILMRHLAAVLAFAEIVLAQPAWAQGQPSIEVAFSPNRGATAAITKLIGHAQKSIRVAAYSFTSQEIAHALLDAYKRGVDVKVVVDKSNATAGYGSAAFLVSAGIAARVDYRYAVMHDKFMVIDGVTVETGSFNYTQAAEKKNAENIVILSNQANIAQQYLKHWQELWDESDPYKARY